MAFAGLAATGLALFAYWWTHSFVCMIENLREKVGRGGLSVLVSVAIVCSILAQKPTTSEPTNNVCVSPMGQAGMSFANLSFAGLNDAFNQTNDLRVTDFCYSNGFAQLSLELCSTNHALPVIDVFANYALTNSTWAWVDSFAIDLASTKASLNVNWPEVFSNQVAIGTFPTNASLDAAFFVPVWSQDADGDGMPDMWEMANGYDPMVAGEGLDSDSDGLLDQEEITIGTNPNNSDTDGDGVDDGDEYYGGMNPLCSDTDGDGISDGDERTWGTNPNEYETYEVQNDDNEPTNGLFTSALNSSNDLLLFTSDQETTAAEGPDYEMVDGYDISIVYQSPYSSDFSILGVSPPGGTTTLTSNMIGIWYNVSGPGYWNAFNLMATGAKFKPLKTGRFSFQAHADDNVLLQIGTGDDAICATAAYEGNNPGNLAQGLLIAGREYPISIEADSIGGPAELSFPIWGRFEPILKPQMVAQFSKSAIIFEDAYRNMPNRRMTLKRSTKSVLSIGVRGGDLGGTLQISTSNANCLSYLHGDDCLTGSFSIDAGETRYWNGTYQGAQASSAQDDVRVTLTFTENETGAITTYTTSLTVVKIELTPNEVAPLEADRHRHIYGVGERVSYSHYPNEVQTSWCFDIGDGNAGNGLFSCPINVVGGKSFCKATASVGNVSFDTKFITLSPHPIGKNPRLMNDDVGGLRNLGSAGRVVMLLDVYAAPLIVSFWTLELREKPDDSNIGEHSGYYNDQSKGGPWSHNSNICNSSWYPISIRGFSFSDKVGTGLAYEKPWEDGYKIWNIPVDWRTSGSAIAYSVEPNPPTIQKFELKRDGTFSISKYGYTATRTVWGWPRINGKDAR